MPSEPVNILGQPSWRVATASVEAYLTRLGGHLGPVTFDLGGRKIAPYAVAPWAEERASDALPAILRALRGDFFCMPFGSNDTPYRGESHPPHGETANECWKLVALRHEQGMATLHASLDTRVRKGHVDKYISLREDHHAVYSRHAISGMGGPMSLGHHAMLKFPDEPGSGRISTSPFLYAQTAPEPVELPENRGYSILQPGASFVSLNSVPTITGERTDLSRFPARKGFEDLVMLVSDPYPQFAWTAVTFPDECYAWFALKDPLMLRHTVFWLSNGGRHYAPWNGRHTGVMGLEEVTANFHYGLGPSAGDNPLRDLGIATCLELDEGTSLDVRYIMAVAEIPHGFDRVRSIKAQEPGSGVLLKSASGMEAPVPVDVSFLRVTREHE